MAKKVKFALSRTPDLSLVVVFLTPHPLTISVSVIGAVLVYKQAGLIVAEI